MIIRSLATAAALAALAAAPAAAQTTVVTPTDLQGWTLTDKAGNGMASIAADHAKPGHNGALHLTGSGTNAKAAYTLTFNKPIALSALTSFSFDWFRGSSSTTAAHFAPSIHLTLSSRDGIFGLPTSSDLAWEYTYNHAGAAPVDAWQSVDLLNDSFYRRLGGGVTNTTCGKVSNGGSQLNQSLASWAASSCYHDPKITGIKVIMGSGWNGTTDMAVDNIRFGAAGFNGGQAITYNFEMTAASSVVPEPSTYALLGAGLAGIGGMVIRRRRQS